MRYGLSFLAAVVVTLSGYVALGAAPLTLPAFHDGMAQPKTIAVVTARAYQQSGQLVSTR